MKRHREEKLLELHEKYHSLVSLVRKMPEDVERDANLRAWCDKVRQKYPQEAHDLADPDIGDWQHGFDSGALAILRLLDVLYTSRSPKRVAEAEQEFPSLDT